MRITGGKWCRRLVKAPATGMRPTQDRVRAAVFATLGMAMADYRFLDLFAGSGAVGLEAASRGAGHVVMVERDRATVAIMRANVQELDTDHVCHIVQGDVLRFIQAPQGETPFDIIYADPPYEQTGSGGCLERLLDMLSHSPLLTPGGIFIMEQSRREQVKAHGAWELIDDRNYGETAVRYFRRGPTGGIQ